MWTRLGRLLITLALLAVSASMGLGPIRAASSCSTVVDVVGLGVTPQDTVLAGTRGHGLYQALHGGRCWTLIPSFPKGVTVGTIIAPPHTTGVILAGKRFLTEQNTAARTVGLYRSNDAGKTWQPGTTGLPHTAILPVQIATSPKGTLVLAYICPQDISAPLPTRRCPQGLARSTDGGRTWQPVGPAIEEMEAVIALTPGTYLAVGVSSTRTSKTATFQSADDGRTWHAISMVAGFPGDLAVLFSPTWAKQQVFAGWGLTILTAAISQSGDGGVHWSPHRKVAAGLGAAVGIIGLSTTHTLLLSTIGKVNRSTDNGRTWTAVLNAQGSVDLRSWALLAAPDGKTAYAGTAEGVVSTKDGGHTWQTPLS